MEIEFTCRSRARTLTIKLVEQLERKVDDQLTPECIDAYLTDYNPEAADAINLALGDMS